MPDDKKVTDSGAEDPIKNLKAEFGRKMDSFEQTQQALLAQLEKMNKPAPATKPTKKESNLDSVWFDKPEAAAEEIVSRAEARIDKKIADNAAITIKQQNVMAELVGAFPELSQGNHELTQAAVRVYNAMSDDEKQSPIAYKAAVKEAALDLGYKPMSKRTEEEQEFSLRGGSRSRSSDSRKSEKLSPETEEFARLMGVDVDKKEVRERLINKHGRKNYTRYA